MFFSRLRKLSPLRRKATIVGLTVSSSTGVYLAVKDPTDLSSTIGAGIRFLRSIKIGMMISLDYYISMLGLTEGQGNYEYMMSATHQRAANRILEGCLVNGGTYIKIGQGLVSLSHILPKEFIKTLTQLQDKCLVRADDEIKTLFVEDFGKTPDEIYKSFDTEPIAAASLAQVYRATTKDDQEVAVKVQYIDLQKRFVTDVATINFLLKVVGLMHPNFDFGWIVADVVGSLRQELDFLNEGKNSEQCAKDLKHLSFVHVPKVFWDLSSQRVLVTEYVDAIKINNKEALQKNGFSLTDINNKLFKTFGEQIFQTGFVHADPHPGNVLVRKHEKRTQLVLLDHGLYQRMSNENRVALSHFWKAIVLKDHKAMAKYSLDLGVKDYGMLAEVLTQRPLKSKNFRLISKLSDEELKYMAQFAQQRFDLIMDTLKSMPTSLLFVVRNLNTIRSIAHDHGDPIDRYTVLAREATKTAFSTENNFIKRLTVIPSRVYFEIQLLNGRLMVWFMRTFLNILYMLGRSPDASSIISKIV
ncbi:PREDICTED: uncharacterized aarF domain-containing protein kinase 5 [Nicrophorus vespilloides]|uniref:Uncharacterized aarF domain-containing protein kinase 5 n=1 Tax=Nicrophorus vespilloides TaxID=110193 RepID=A0ABM1MJG4_NICVS|nr:PREDICTED: uncharacterized aarF domain-containing protein kinase 5 [Nicrophorus vespilloides]XP_017774714.1 PREDICTED: uncharacterized aarF domain-containing protein kinase 5 [Nicrophorus vespilloides]